MTLIIIALGFVFGTILQYANLNRFDTISGMAVLKDFTVAKTIATAIGIGAILISTEVALGFASYHVKPFIVGSTILGGIVFGIGMAILGYCPGTLPVSLGQGSIDALAGIIGGLIAGLLYTILSPFIHEVAGPNLGTLSLHEALKNSPVLFHSLVIIIGVLFITGAFILNKIEKKKELRWFVAGIGIALVGVLVFATAITDRVIGASTFYAYAADNITGITDNAYYLKSVEKSGNWEMKFLFGAFVSGIAVSLIRGQFAFRVIHENWRRLKGTSAANRLTWAFIGGFLLLFGARLASGCTSGHIISGGMQLAVSSLTFAVFVFASFLTTGKLFYGR